MVALHHITESQRLLAGVSPDGFQAALYEFEYTGVLGKARRNCCENVLWKEINSDEVVEGLRDGFSFMSDKRLIEIVKQTCNCDDKEGKDRKIRMELGLACACKTVLEQVATEVQGNSWLKERVGEAIDRGIRAGISRGVSIDDKVRIEQIGRQVAEREIARYKRALQIKAAVRVIMSRATMLAYACAANGLGLFFKCVVKAAEWAVGLGKKLARSVGGRVKKIKAGRSGVELSSVVVGGSAAAIVCMVGSQIALRSLSNSYEDTLRKPFSGLFSGLFGGRKSRPKVAVPLMQMRSILRENNPNPII